MVSSGKNGGASLPIPYRTLPERLAAMLPPASGTCLDHASEQPYITWMISLISHR
jgi:hypothetical protein